MEKLQKTDSEYFKNYCVGYNPETDTKIIAILDDNCVRWISVTENRRPVKHELGNHQKELCIKNAEKALNRKPA